MQGIWTNPRFGPQKGSHVHKQLATLYVRRDDLAATNNWQFCMYVETTSSGVRPRFGSSWDTQASIVRARAPGDAPPALAGSSAAQRILNSPRTRYIYREVQLFPAARSSSKSLVRTVSIASSLMRFMSCFFFFCSRPDPRPDSDAHDESRPSSGRTCRHQRESGETPPRRSYRRSARSKCGLRLCLASTQLRHGSGHVSLLWRQASDQRIFRRLPATHTQSLQPVSKQQQAPRWSLTRVQCQKQPTLR